MIFLIDVDALNRRAEHVYPNLALMKISAWAKASGEETSLNRFDRTAADTYLSCVFTKNADQARQLQAATGAVAGGSGVPEWGGDLDDEVEHLCPDYDLYGADYSMGFTSRGCIRKCSFCIVPEKEGGIREHSPLHEFVRHRRVVLLDNNFLASPNWREKIDEMIDRKLDVDFNQGLDARLIDEEAAVKLATLKPKLIRMAFDHPNSEREIRTAAANLDRAGYRVARKRVMCYVLMNYGTTFDEDMHRLRVLIDLDIRPYVQCYGAPPKITRELKSWANSMGYVNFPDFFEWMRLRGTYAEAMVSLNGGGVHQLLDEVGG